MTAEQVNYVAAAVLEVVGKNKDAGATYQASGTFH
jgi:hypothetical protein